MSARDDRIAQLQEEAADDRKSHKAEVAGVAHRLELAEDAARTLEAELEDARTRLAQVQATRVWRMTTTLWRFRDRVRGFASWRS